MAINYNGNSVKVINYAGKNYQPIADWAETTINGVTCRIENGVGYLNGTSTAGSWRKTEQGTIHLQAGTYTLYFWTNYANSTGIGLGLYNSSHTDLYQLNAAKYKTFTLTQDESFDIVFWWSTSNMAFNNVYIKTMVKPGAYDSETVFDPISPNNDVKRVIKDGVVVWCKPYSARVADSDNGEIKILSSEEPSAVIGTGFTNGTVYYGDTVQCTWKGGSESTSTIVPSPTSLSVPALTDAFQGSVKCTIKNDNSYSAKYYWYALCQASSGQVRIPSSGYNGGSTLASGASTTVSVASAGAYSSVIIYVYFVITGSKTDIFKTYGPKNTSGVTGLYNATTTTTAISSTLNKYTTTGDENGSDVVVNSTYSENQEGPYSYDIQTNTSNLSLRTT